MQSPPAPFVLIVILIIVFLSAAIYVMKKPQESTTTTPTPVAEENKVSGAIFKTNLGDIEVAFFESEAPQTVENFVTLTKKGFYDGTRFHRVIKDFMIQGGDPLSKDVSVKNRWGTGGPGYTFADEINDEKLVRGVLVMANAGPNTNGSQFFIITAEKTPWLDGKHTAFGKVVKGMDVVTKIGELQTDHNDRPETDVILEKVILK